MVIRLVIGGSCLTGIYTALGAVDFIRLDSISLYDIKNIFSESVTMTDICMSVLAFVGIQAALLVLQVFFRSLPPGFPVF